MPVTVINSDGKSSSFSIDRVTGSLVRGGLDGPTAVARATALGSLVSSSGAEVVSTDALRAGIGELTVNPQAPDAGRVGAILRDSTAATPERPATPAPLAPVFFFTIDGVPAPPPIPVPPGATDLHVVWNPVSGVVVAAWWTSRGIPGPNIPIPAGANDWYFSLQSGLPLPAPIFPPPGIPINDFELFWEGDRIVEAWWTFDGKPVQKLDLPPGATAIHVGAAISEIDAAAALVLNFEVPDYTSAAPIDPLGSELMGRAGRFLEATARALDRFVNGAPLAADDTINLYNEGASIQALGVAQSARTGQHLTDRLTGQIVEAETIPSFAELVAVEKAMQFSPKMLIALFAPAKPAPAPEIDWEQVVDELILKILGVFGITEFYETIIDALHGDFQQALDDVIKALKKKGLTVAIEKILKLLFSKAFRAILKRRLIAKLGKKAGEEAAKKIAAKLAAKFIPILGWAVLIGNILAVVISQVIGFAVI
jgi:hypothetical protein